jgi:TRAP-type mannitol/chloroaromatic compound transport system substrate-binding protein
MALAKAEALQGEMLTKFEKEGVKLRQFNKTMLDAFAKASKEVIAEESAKDATFKKVYESMAAFQNKNRNWHNLGFLPRDYK